MGLVALSSTLLPCESSWAQVECSQAEKHVVVSFEGGWTDAVKNAALSDLAAALGPKQLGVCSGDQEEAARRVVSSVRVELLDANRVRIEVDDSLTNKVVSRAIQVEDSTESSSGLIVAVAIDELLRATWAELAIKKEEPDDQAAPSPVPPRPMEETPEPGPARPRLPAHRVALSGALDAYVVGSAFFGANILYGSSVADVIEWDAFAGPRWVRAKNASELGQVRADALAMGVSLRAPLLATSKFFFGPELGVAATHAWFRGRATVDEGLNAADEDFQGWAVTGRVGLDARLHLGEAFVSGSTRVGFPLRALEVTDGADVVGGMTGLEWSNGLSLGWWWP